MNRTETLLLITVLVISTPARATTDSDADTLLSTLRIRYPATVFSEVRPTPASGLFEVWMQGNVVYVLAAQPRYWLFGRLFDGDTLGELTGSAPTFRDGLLPSDAHTQRREVELSEPGCPYNPALETQP